MKKKTILVASLAVLGLMATGCQKEQMLVPQSTIAENAAIYTVNYSVDGESNAVILHNDDELAVLLQQLNALVRQGHRVVVSQNGTTNTASAKEVVTFTTYSEEEMLAWEIARIKEGYTVTVVYDEKTGIYTGTAIR
ncbi:MAG: hypothetical protein J6X88_10735 [Bacteroidales bacterium]|nr:hypothetical protein [Bacteroidales bacterium]